MRDMILSGTTFDLSEISIADYRRGYRLFHLVGLIGSIALTIVWIGALVVLAVQSGLAHLSLSVIAGFSFGAAVVGVLALASLMNAPGAIALEVRTDGLRLVYASGRAKQFPWADSRTTVTLYEFPEVLPGGRPFPLSRFWLATHFPLSNPLTSEAFGAVLRSAEAAQLRVTRSSNALGTSRTVIRIMGSGNIVAHD